MDYINTFTSPEHKILSISTETEYNEAHRTSKSKLSNSCFLHRICWNVFFRYRYITVNNCICLIADDNLLNRAHIVYPLGHFSDQELKDIIYYWMKIFSQKNKRLRIEFIDEQSLVRLCNCLDEEGLSWSLENCESCYDYTYHVSDYINLVGKENKGKRNLWNRYMKNHNSYRIERVEKKNIQDCRIILEIWEQQKGLSKSDLLYTDHYPLEFFLNHIDVLDNCSFLLYRNRIPVAFFVASINNKCCTFHFAKSNRIYSEVNFLLHFLFLTSEYAKNIEFLNFEDDISNMNIRKYKNRIARGVTLKKYAIEVENI